VNEKGRTFAQAAPEYLYFSAFRTPQSRLILMSVDSQDASYPSLRGRSVFITGGGSGIGGCMTEAFARQGSLVAFVDYAETVAERECT